MKEFMKLFVKNVIFTLSGIFFILLLVGSFALTISTLINGMFFYSFLSLILFIFVMSMLATLIDGNYF